MNEAAARNEAWRARFTCAAAVSSNDSSQAGRASCSYTVHTSHDTHPGTHSPIHPSTHSEQLALQPVTQRTQRKKRRKVALNLTQSYTQAYPRGINKVS